MDTVISDRPPGLRDPATWALVALAALLFTLSWARVDGYLVADEVEYLDRAEEIWTRLRGGGSLELDPRTVRSAAFSLLLVPLVAVGDLLGGGGSALTMVLARLGVLVFSCLLVVETARAGSRLFGRGAGLCAGLVLASNPVLILYGISPLAALPAALCCLRGFVAAVEARDRRGGLRAGGWLGLAAVLSFQSFAVLAAILVFVVGRDRLRPGSLTGLLLGVAGFLLAQGLLDLAVYGHFASSLGSYLAANLVVVVATGLYDIGLHGVGIAIYDALGVAEQVDEAHRSTHVGLEVHRRFPKAWYLAQAPHSYLAWPLLGGLLGLPLLARTRGRGVWVPLVGLSLVLALNLLALSLKGTKSLRLMLPLLPLLALLVGAGFSGLAGVPLRRARALGVAALLLAAASVSLAWLRDLNRSEHAGYWRALAAVERSAESRGTTLVTVSAYHWAVQFHHSRAVELVKLPSSLDRWRGLDTQEREATLGALAQADAVVLHEQILTENPDLLAAVNARFAVTEAFYDPDTHVLLGPVLVLEQRRGMPGERTFFEVFRDADPDAYVGSIENAFIATEFRRPTADGSEDRIVFLGFDLESGVDGGRLFWITYHWYCGHVGDASYMVVDRLADQAGEIWQNNHYPAWEAAPTDGWEDGWIVRESFLVPWRQPARGEEPARGFDLAASEDGVMALGLFLGLIELTPERDEVAGEMGAFLADSVGRLAEPGPGAFAPVDSPRWSGDGLFAVGQFKLPIPGDGVEGGG